MTQKWFNLEKRTKTEDEEEVKKTDALYLCINVFYLKMHPFFLIHKQTIQKKYSDIYFTMSETFHPFIIFLPGTHLKNQNKKNAP